MWVNKHIKNTESLWVFIFGAVLAVAVIGYSPSARAITALPTPLPGSGSYGLEATKTQPPPTTGARIVIPSNGTSFSTSPTTVSGICTNDLLVEIYDNSVMVGSIDCQNGSFSIQVSLFVGLNVFTANVFDDLDQAGPVSNSVTVTYSNSTLTAFGTLITLTSSYGRRGAFPGNTLTWPLQLSGGTGPYAFSIDWGDGSPPDLKSQAITGEVDISHVYSKAGIYHVLVKVTDVNGNSAYLQVVAVANGNVTAKPAATAGNNSTTVTKVLWFPVLIMFFLLIPAFWLGRNSQKASSRINH